MPQPTFQTLYRQTDVDTTTETIIAPNPGRDEVLIDSSGTGVATVKVKAHADGTYKTVATLTNDDVVALAWSPFFEVVGVGIVGEFIVGFGAGPVGA